MGSLNGASLTSRTAVALLVANTRYWTTVAPTVNEQLKRWERSARSIPDSELRTVAITKLHGESFNAEGTTTLATLASRTYRASSTRAIVAFQVMYDYLDGLAEQPGFDHQDEGATLFNSFTDALSSSIGPKDYYLKRPQGDAGYLVALTATVRNALVWLPAKDAILPTARRTALRCAEAQRQVHATTGTAELQAWATERWTSDALSWQEFLAGAVTSALSLYALIAVGSDPRTTASDADALGSAYFSIAALATMLDTLIDREQDLHAQTQWFLPCYGGDTNLLIDHALQTARRAASEVTALPRASEHLVTLIGVAAYYLSAPEANREPTRRLTEQLKREFGPLLSAILILMRAWRARRRP